MTDLITFDQFDPDEKLYAATSVILNIAELALESKLTEKDREFFNIYVSHGPPVETAEYLLVAYASGMGPTGAVGAEGGTIPGQMIVADIAEITVSLRECTPGLDFKGREPTTQELDDYARMTYLHALAIYCALKKERKPNGRLGCLFTTSPIAQAIEEQGQRAGWDITLGVEL